jgi:hypothetical protein
METAELHRSRPESRGIDSHDHTPAETAIAAMTSTEDAAVAAAGRLEAYAARVRRNCVIASPGVRRGPRPDGFR